MNTNLAYVYDDIIDSALPTYPTAIANALFEQYEPLVANEDRFEPDLTDGYENLYFIPE